MENYKQLENAVLNLSAQELDALCEEIMPVEFTARALGNACRFRGLEFVKVLLRHGAAFEFEFDFLLGAKYFCISSFMKHIYNFNFMLMLIKESFFSYSVRCPVYADDGCVLPAAERAKTMDYLIRNAREDTYFNASMLFYYAVVSCEKELLELLDINELSRLLREKSAHPGFFIHLYSPIPYDADKSFFEYRMETLSQEDRLFVLNTFEDHLAQWDIKPALYAARFGNIINSPPLLANAVRRADCSKVTTSALMKSAIDFNCTEAISLIIEQGRVKTPRQRDGFIEYASANQKTEALAFLLDYKNRTADLAAEAAKAEKKMLRELTQSPDSAAALKKIWGIENNEDGTLTITRYKGTETDVTVPAKIGRKAVTAIGREAFSPSQRCQNIKTRVVLKRIIIPEGVKKIGERAFESCFMLMEAIIPDSVNEIGQSAFEHCRFLAIRAHTNSCAHSFAQKARIKFRALEK